MNLLPLLLPLTIFISKETRNNNNITKNIIFVFLYSLLFVKLFETNYTISIVLSIAILSIALFSDLYSESFNVVFPLSSLLIVLISNFDMFKIIVLLILFLVLLIAVKLKLIANGEPFLILTSLYFINIWLWLPFVLTTFFIALIFLLVFKRNIKSVPLGPFLIFSLIIFL